jgi:hypothetical protein
MNNLQKIKEARGPVHVPVLSSIGVLAVTQVTPIDPIFSNCYLTVEFSEFARTNNAVRILTKVYVRLPRLVEEQVLRRVNSTTFPGYYNVNFTEDFPELSMAIHNAFAKLELMNGEKFVGEDNTPLYEVITLTYFDKGIEI